MFSFLKRNPKNPEKLCEKCSKNSKRKESILCRSCIHYYNAKRKENSDLNACEACDQLLLYASHFVKSWQIPIIRAESAYKTEEIFKKGGEWDQYEKRRNDKIEFN